MFDETPGGQEEGDKSRNNSGGEEDGETSLVGSQSQRSSVRSSARSSARSSHKDTKPIANDLQKDGDIPAYEISLVLEN
eukprot:UN34831